MDGATAGMARYPGDPPGQAVRDNTNMEMLCMQLSTSLGRFRELNDKIGEQVLRFCNNPIPGPAPTSTGAISPAEPPPGTLGALTLLADRLAAESDRYESLGLKLRSIL